MVEQFSEEELIGIRLLQLTKQNNMLLAEVRELKAHNAKLAGYKNHMKERRWQEREALEADRQAYYDLIIYLKEMGGIRRIKKIMRLHLEIEAEAEANKDTRRELKKLQKEIKSLGGIRNIRRAVSQLTDEQEAV